MTTEKEKKPRKRKPRIKCDYSVKLYEDGKYHWLYDLHMLKNPAVLFDLFWALGVSTAITVFIIFCIQACSNGINADDLMIVLKIAGILIGIMLVLGVLGYLLYAALSGWIYSVHFIMDENGVEHKAAPRSKKLAKRIGFLTVLVGLFSRKPGMMGTGILASSNTSMSSDFLRVRSVKAVRWMNTIKVNERFSRNRVYVSDEDFDFVFDYISSRCPIAKKNGKTTLPEKSS